MVKPQICVTLQRNLLGFASAFTKRNVERNVRSITRDHISTFAGRTAEEGKGKGKACLKISGPITEVLGTLHIWSAIVRSSVWILTSPVLVNLLLRPM